MENIPFPFQLAEIALGESGGEESGETFKMVNQGPGKQDETENQYAKDPVGMFLMMDGGCKIAGLKLVRPERLSNRHLWERGHALKVDGSIV